jgi:hypothetical protein
MALEEEIIFRFGMPKYIIVLTMTVNGWKSSMLFVGTMELFTSSLHQHDHSAMGWWNN